MSLFNKEYVKTNFYSCSYGQYQAPCVTNGQLKLNKGFSCFSVISISFGLTVWDDHRALWFSRGFLNSFCYTGQKSR